MKHPKQLMQLLLQIAKSLRDLVYPPLCLHCTASIEPNLHYLCKDCIQHIEFLDVSDRCPYCCSIDYQPIKAFCKNCHKNDPIVHRCAAAFHYDGPASTLIRQLKYGDQPYLARGIAALMAMQFIALKWPFPNLIVPVPISRSHLLSRGYNQSFLLAKSLGVFLNRPVAEVFIRRSGDYSQAGLSRTDRIKLGDENFSVIPKLNIENCSILIIDDVMTTGSTLKRCAELLLPYWPSEICALAACKAD